MFKKLLIGGFVLLLLSLVSAVIADDNIKHLQNVSFNVKAAFSEGSATVVIREVQKSEENKIKEKVTFVVTAAHVVDGLRTVREVIDPQGNTKKLVEFKDAQLVREFREDGRRVGETKVDAQVIRYSDADNGEDIAVLMVRQRDFCKDGATFYLKEEIPEVGTHLWHCGSLLGQMGANSITDGLVSQIGRVHEGKVYDQTTVPAFPGSSGGGVWMVKDNKPLYVGMITRGAGETFNLMVPVRRVLKWSKDADCEWVFDPNKKMPTMDELLKAPIEKVQVGSKPRRAEDKSNQTPTREFGDNPFSNVEMGTLIK